MFLDKIKKEWEKHKYIAKVKINNGKNRYFYTRDAYLAYLHGKDSSNNKKNNSFSNVISNLFNSNTSIKELSNGVTSSGKKVTENLLEKLNNETTHKYVAKIKNSLNKVRYFYSEKEYAAYLKGKNFVQNTLGEIKPTETYSNLLADGKNFVQLKIDEIKSETTYSDLLSKGKDAINKVVDKIGSDKIAGYRLETYSVATTAGKVVSALLGGALGSMLYSKLTTKKRLVLDEEDDNVLYPVKPTKKEDDNVQDPDKPTKKKYKKIYQPFEVPDRHGVKPSDDKYDNVYSDREILDNLKAGGVLDDWMKKRGFESEEEILEYMKSHKIDDRESLSYLMQAQGLMDESQPGYHPESYDDLKRLSVDMNDDLDMEKVNADNLTKEVSDYGITDDDGDGYPDTIDIGYSQNCAYCTLAYEMRQRGYDVEASYVSRDTCNTTKVIESWYKDGEFTRVTPYYKESHWYGNTIERMNPENLQKRMLESNPEGSRGQFCVNWKGGGGHSVVYEVVNGEVIIRDCQINKKWKLTEWPYNDRVTQYKYMRTDNLELADEALVGVKNKK